MKSTKACKHHARTRVSLKNGVTAALLFAVALLTSLGWAGESWGQGTVRRVGIITGKLDLTSDYAQQWWFPFRRTLADGGWIEGKNVSFESLRVEFPAACRERWTEVLTSYPAPWGGVVDLFAEAGGTLAYGPHQVSLSERCAVLVAKILAGAKPGDLPVERPSKFELVVNLKTAKTLGIKIPQAILLRADKVIR